MFRLKSAAAEPFWLEILPSQKTQFRPLTVAMVLAARDEAGKAALAVMHDDGTSDLAVATANVQFATSLAKLAIVAWEGVGDADGKETPPTPEAIAEYMADIVVFDAVRAKFIGPQLASVEEKNASAPSRPGTSGAKMRARNTARPARKSAKPARTG